MEAWDQVTFCFREGMPTFPVSGRGLKEGSLGSAGLWRSLSEQTHIAGLSEDCHY